MAGWHVAATRREKMKSLGFALLLLAGCSGYTARNACHPTDLGTVWSDAPMDCALVQYDVDMARWALTKYKPHGHSTPIMSLQQFRNLANAAILVAPKEELLADGKREGGHFEIFKGIRLNHDMWNLAHELLHDFDVQNDRLWTEGHPGWEDRGYMDAARAYDLMSLRIDPVAQ